MNRSGRERLIRYCLRGPLALERLSRLPGGLIAYRTMYGRGQRTHLILRPVELLARLSSLMHCARALLSPCSWTYVDSVQPAGLRPLRFHHPACHFFGTSECLHLTVPIGIVLCQRIPRANSLTWAPCICLVEVNLRRDKRVAIDASTLVGSRTTDPPTPNSTACHAPDR